jgi:GTP cyclohydrolase III
MGENPRTFFRHSIQNSKREQSLTPKKQFELTTQFVDPLARTYGWTEQAILDLPFCRVLDYTELIKEQRQDEMVEKLSEQTTLAQAVAAAQSKKPAQVAEKLEKETRRLQKQHHAQRYERKSTLDTDGKPMDKETEKKLEQIFGPRRGKKKE